MNKAELVGKMAGKAGLTKKDAEKALNAFVASVQEALVKKDKVQLIGFGTFEVKERAARMGRKAQERFARLGPASAARCEDACRLGGDGGGDSGGKGQARHAAGSVARGGDCRRWTSGCGRDP